MGDGRLTFVSGAASGIGRATAFAFGRKRDRLVLVDIDAEGCAKTARIINDAGGSAVDAVADICDTGAMQDVIDRAVSRFGPLTCAANVAGVNPPAVPFLEQAADTWQRCVTLNLNSLFALLQVQIRAMLPQRAGSITNVASVYGLVSSEYAAAYSATKHGIIGLTRSTAIEFASKGIRINAVAPGAIETRMLARTAGGLEAARRQFVPLQPIGRLGKPEEVAGAIAWLCSPEASFVVGHTLVVDGGYTAR